MKLTKLLCVFAMLIFSFGYSMGVSAENWVKLGYLSNVDMGPIKKDIMGKNWAYDRDSMNIDKENRIIEVSIKDEEPSGKIWLGDYYEVTRIRLYFSNDPAQCYFIELYQDDYSKRNNKHLEHDKAIYREFKNFSKAKRNEYYTPFVFWKEFGYYLDLPNQDGTPYVTPKSLGLTWAESTSKVGLFYYPDTLRVKGSKVFVKYCIWSPTKNTYQMIDGLFDYSNSCLYAYSSATKRISSNDIKVSFEAGYNRISNPVPFNTEKDILFVPEYFRRFL